MVPGRPSVVLVLQLVHIWGASCSGMSEYDLFWQGMAVTNLNAPQSINASACVTGRTNVPLHCILRQHSPIRL